MFERFTDSARQIVVQAQSQARQLGHGFIGCEHLLLALVSLDEPAAAVLRDHGLTPERTRAEVIRLVGPGRTVSLLAGLDREALASIGIDLDAVRSRIEALFGPDALTRAVPAVRRRRRRGLRSRLGRPARNARLLPPAPGNRRLEAAARPYPVHRPRQEGSGALPARGASGGRQPHRRPARRARPAQHGRWDGPPHPVGPRCLAGPAAGGDPRPLPQSELIPVQLFPVQLIVGGPHARAPHVLTRTLPCEGLAGRAPRPREGRCPGGPAPGVLRPGVRYVLRRCRGRAS